MKKCVCMLSALSLLTASCVGMNTYAAETEAVSETEAMNETEEVNETEAMDETEAVSETEAMNETEEPEYEDYSSLGYSIKATDQWEGLKGHLEFYPMSSSPIMDDPELYVSVMIYVPMTMEEAGNMDPEALLEQETYPGILCTFKGDRDQLMEQLDYLGVFDGEVDEADLVQVGEADGYQYFVLYNMDEEFAASLDEEYAEDYKNLPTLITKELEQARYSAPQDPLDAVEGQKLQFTTTDLDGNTVTSEELFGDNEITIVNLWGTWCPNCVDEMDELAEIHTRLLEKGCGVIGLEWEQDPDDETYQTARDLMEEMGTNYPSALMPEGNEILEMVPAFPATFFVDREGTILADPIVGALVDEYETTVESLLEGKAIPEAEAAEAAEVEEAAEAAEAAEVEEAAEAAEMEETAEASESFTYRVFVKDEEDQPVGKAVVQFCDDTSCRMGKTNDDGCAEFEVPEEKIYEIHVLKVPEGYEFDKEASYSSDAAASDMTIIVKKAQ